MQTNGDRHHGETPLRAPRTRPARLENAPRRYLRGQCVIRAAFGHRRNHGRHDVLDSQVLGRDDARRRDALCTAGVWVGRDGHPTSILRVRHWCGARRDESYIRPAAARFFAAAPGTSRRPSARTRFR